MTGSLNAGILSSNFLLVNEFIQREEILGFRVLENGCGPDLSLLNRLGDRRILLKLR